MPTIVGGATISSAVASLNPQMIYSESVVGGVELELALEAVFDMYLIQH